MYQKGGIKVFSLISSESLRNLWYLLGIFGIFLNHVRIFAISKIFMEPLDRFKRNIFSPYLDISEKIPSPPQCGDALYFSDIPKTILLLHQTRVSLSG